MAFRRLLPRLPVARAALNSAVRMRGRTCELGCSYDGRGNYRFASQRLNEKMHSSRYVGRGCDIVRQSHKAWE